MVMMLPSQKMLLCIIGGIIIGTSDTKTSLIYLLFSVVIFIFEKDRINLALKILKLTSFLIFIYFIGSINIHLSFFNNILTGIQRSLPIVSSITFIIILTNRISPNDIRDGTESLLSIIPAIPAKEIAFMASMSFSFLTEGLKIWKQHLNILLFRRRKIKIKQYGIAFIYSPLITLFKKADMLTDAYMFRVNHDAAELLKFKIDSFKFWFIFSFLFAIKIVRLYTT